MLEALPDGAEQSSKVALAREARGARQDAEQVEEEVGSNQELLRGEAQP
jgi:hypothetical protein